MRSYVCVVLGFMVSALALGCNSVQRSHYDPETGMIYPAKFQRPSLFAKKKPHDAATCPLCNPHGVHGDEHGNGIQQTSGMHSHGSGIEHAGYNVEHAHHNGSYNGQVVHTGHSANCTCAAPRPVAVPSSKRPATCGHKDGCKCGNNCRCGQQGHCGANQVPHQNCGGQVNNCGNCGGHIASPCCSPCESMGGYPSEMYHGPMMEGGMMSSGCAGCGTPGSYVSGYGGSSMHDGFAMDGHQFEGTVIPGQGMHGFQSNCPTCNTSNSSMTPGPLFNGESIPGEGIQPQPEPAKVPPASDYDEKPMPGSGSGTPPNNNTTRSPVPYPTPRRDVQGDGEFIEPSRLNPTTMMIPNRPAQSSQNRHVHWTPSSGPIFEIE